MYVGVDHSTTGIKISSINGERPETTFRIDRRDLDQANAVLQTLDERVGLSEITLATVTYSFGNGISEIQGIENVSNKGIKDLVGLSYGTGAGELVFDQLRDSAIPTVVLPGVHRGLETLHSYFRHYSTLGGADKVASLRYALKRVRSEFASPGTFIWACASSSCMAGLVCKGRLKGFFHWVGPVHGWPDPEAIRRGVDSDFNEVFMECGLVPRHGGELTDVHDISDTELLEAVYLSTIQNIYSLYPFACEFGSGSLDAIVLSGRLVRREQPVAVGRKVYERCLDIAPVLFTEPYTSAHGAALVAKDVAEGSNEVLGIPVGDVPVTRGEAKAGAIHSS